MSLQHSYLSRKALAFNDPGRLDRRIVVQSATISRDSVGGQISTWATLATVWASLNPLSGSRLYAAAAKNSEATVLFRVRYLSTVRSFMRVVHGQATYEIVSVQELGRRHLMDMECRLVNQADVPVTGDFGSDFDNTDFNSGGTPAAAGGDFGSDFAPADFKTT